MKGNRMQLNVCMKSVYDVYLFCSTRTLRDQASGTLSRFSLIKVAGSVVREVVSCHLPHLPLLPDRQINVASLTWETRAISTVLYKHCSCVTGELPEKVFCSILACPIRFCWIKCFNQATRVKGEVIYISNSCQVSWFIVCFVFVWSDTYFITSDIAVICLFQLPSRYSWCQCQLCRNYQGKDSTSICFSCKIRGTLLVLFVLSEMQANLEYQVLKKYEKTQKDAHAILRLCSCVVKDNSGKDMLRMALDDYGCFFSVRTFSPWSCWLWFLHGLSRDNNRIARSSSSICSTKCMSKNVKSNYCKRKNSSPRIPFRRWWKTHTAEKYRTPIPVSSVVTNLSSWNLSMICH